MEAAIRIEETQNRELWGTFRLSAQGAPLNWVSPKKVMIAHWIKQASLTMEEAVYWDNVL